MVDINPGIEQLMFHQLHQLLFDVLMTNDGRTTDLLETLTGEKTDVQVIRQEQIDMSEFELAAGLSGGPYYLRESVLVGERTGFVVSHNFALVCARHVPPVMFESLAAKQDGIGKAISALGLPTSRKLQAYGWREEKDVIDLFYQPFTLRFPFQSPNARTPFKRYAIHFEERPGIHLLEYFNPDIIRHRLLRDGGW